MKLKTLFAVCLAASCSFASISFAQTKTTQLIVTNAVGTFKLTPLTGALQLDGPLVMQSFDKTTSIKFDAPSGGGPYTLTLPAAAGTLLTTAAGIATNSSQLGGVPAANYLTTSSSALGDVTGTFGSLSLATLSPAVNGTYTNATVTVDAKGRIIAASSGSGGSVTTDLTLKYTGPNLGIDLTNSNTWGGTQTFSNPIAGSITGNAATATSATTAGSATTATSATSATTATTATTANTLAVTDPAGQSAISAINLAASGTIGAGRLPNLQAMNGLLDVTRGGTGLATVTANRLVMGNGTSALALVAAGTDTHVLTLVAGVPTWQAPSGGGSLVVNSTLTYSSPNLGLNLGNANTWTQDQLLPASATQGANLVAAVHASTSVVNVAHGGTGQSTYTNGQLMIGNSTGNTLTKSTLTAGSGVTITNGTGTITIASNGEGVKAGVTSGVMSDNVTNYYKPNSSTSGTNTTTGTGEITAQISGTLCNFTVVLSAAVGNGAGKARTFNLKNVTTGNSITCSFVASNTITTINSGAATLAVTSGDVLRIEQIPASNPTGASAIWSYSFVP